MSQLAAASTVLSRRHQLVLFTISVAAWIAFAGFYGRVYPIDVSSPGFTPSWWTWFVGSAVVLPPLFLGLLRVLRIGRGVAVQAAVALSAPALVCDVLTGMNPDWWLLEPGSAAGRHYLSLIVGGVGLLQLFALWWQRNGTSEGP